ncbi:OLC1v1030691C1 [Oldenlandia corymbosa var. corymbosa]|uniref:OLC1v1030691C1 n=1 Tax=Oldenlandia corymbosa var. corymbosa TaxID=529605 RepID=A0AAV1CJL8_OLDCO|nr:OLC1v1030691C1 [Oldenlandia corymbosa var. corymbosa]
MKTKWDAKQARLIRKGILQKKRLRFQQPVITGNPPVSIVVPQLYEVSGKRKIIHRIKILELPCPDPVIAKKSRIDRKELLDMKRNRSTIHGEQMSEISVKLSCGRSYRLKRKVFLDKRKGKVIPEKPVVTMGGIAIHGSSNFTFMYSTDTSSQPMKESICSNRLCRSQFQKDKSNDNATDFPLYKSGIVYETNLI